MVRSLSRGWPAPLLALLLSALALLLSALPAAAQSGAPAVTGVSITSRPSLKSSNPVVYWPYQRDDHVDVTVTFSRAVTVTGAPRLALTVGSRTRQAAFRSASGSSVNFRYTTIGGDRDADGIAIAAYALTLNGGSIEAGGVAAALGLGSHALGDQSNHRVDGAKPTFDGVASPAYAFTRGARGSFTLPAAGSATIFSTYALAATPALPGGLSFAAATRTLSGTPEVGMAQTTYTLNVNHPTPDFQGTELSDSLAFTVTVAGAVPAVSGVSIASSPASGSSYATGENIDVEVTFNYPVTVTGTPRLALGIGSATRQAAYRTHSGSTASFRYPVIAADSDGDGISIAAGALALNGGSIEASNVAVALGLGSHAIANDAGHTVNDLQPSFGTTTVANQHYVAGTAASVQLPAASGGDGTVSHALTGPGAATTLSLPQGLSWNPATRTISGTPGAAAAAATYTWTATDGDGDTAQLSFSVTVAATNAPTVTGVSIASSPAGGSSYATGENIDVAVTFSRAVTVTGSPRLALTVGSRTRHAAFRSASGSTVNFRYTTIGGDRDSDGVSIAADALTLNGGSIEAGSVDAALGLGGHALGNQSNHRVDGGGPTFAGVASPALSFTRGTQGSFTLPAATPGSATYALAATPALPAGLTFNFGTRTLSGTVAVGMAKTTYTLNAYRLVPYPGEEGVFYEELADTLAFTVAVSGAVPAVIGVEIASSPADGFSYATGEDIEVQVTFNYPVAVLGTPRLALGIGSATRQAEHILSGGGDDSRQRFRYRVTASDFDRDGIGIAAGALTAALPSRITAANLDVALGLGSHAIATAADHTVNDLRPSFGATVANQHYVADTAASLQLPAASGGDATVSHALTGPGAVTTLSLPQGLSWNAATRTISGTPAAATAAGSYTWTATDGDGDTARLSFDITVAAADAPKPTSLALSAPAGFDGDYAAGEVVRAIVSFDKNVTVTGTPRLALTIGSNTRQAAYASGSSDADDLAFHYTVTGSDFDGDGLDIGSDALALNGGSIVDAGDASVAASLGLGGLAIGGPSGRTVRDTRPAFSQAASAANRSLEKDAATSTTLPLATGGDGALTYSISPALPAGLTLASARPTIAGTPTVAGATTHTLTATDADGDRATLGPFTVTVVVVPKVTGVSITSRPSLRSENPNVYWPYQRADHIDVTVTFSQAVTVTGSPRLALTVGSRARQAAFRSASGSTVNFRYTTIGGDRDSDGISIAADALTLNGGSIEAGGVDAALGLGGHALGNQSDHRVAGEGPTFDGVASPAYAFTRGTRGSFTLPAAGSATVFSSYALAATPALPGGLSFDAATRILSGTPEVGMATTTYTLNVNHPVPGRDGGARTELADSLTFTVAVSGAVPAVSGVAIASSPADGSSYATDENIDVEVTFNYPVTVTGTPRLALGIGSATRQAAYRTHSGSTASFRYRVTAADFDNDGISIAAGALTLNGGGIEASNVAAALGLGGHAIATAAGHKVNDLQPSFGATVANQHYVAGTAASLRLPAASGGNATVSHALTGPGTVTTLSLPQGLSWNAATRTISGTPAAATAAGSYTWTATDGDGDTARLSFAITVAAADAPKPTSLALSAPAGFDGDYAAGEVVRAIVSFDKNVTVTGAPRLALDIGGVTRQAAYASADSDADELSFRYTVTASDFDGDGLDIGSDALTLNGGGIADAADTSVAASLGLGGLSIGGPSGRTVRDTRPAFSQAASAADRLLEKDAAASTTLPLATGGDGALTYGISPALPAGLTLASARPTIAGTPTVAGATTHTLTATDADGDRATLGPFTVTVAVVPKVTGVSITSRPSLRSENPNVYWPYEGDDHIDVTVTFSQAVTVTGSPRLALTVGTRTRQAAFRSASGSTVNFRYSVVWGDRDADGISIAADALTLDGGGIEAGGVDAALGLGSHALGNQSNHRVDGAGPTFDGVASPAYAFTRGTRGSFTLPAAGSATGPHTYALAATPALPGGLSFDAATRTLSGTPEVGMAKTTYTLNVNRPTPDLQGTELADSLPFTVTVAGAVPAVSGVSIASSPASGSNYATGENIDVEVTFNYPVAVTGTPRLALGIGSATRQAAYRTRSGSTASFRYQVVAADVDRNGISIAADALTLNGGSIEASNVAVALGLGSHAIATAAGHQVNDPRPSFGTTTVANQHYVAGAAASLQLPAASGGDATVSHALTGPGAVTTLTLPQGLSWNAATRTISGTPAAAAAAATYTWTATDGDGDPARLSFDITVAAANAPKPTALALSAPTGFDGDYAAGEVVRALVSFDRNVTVTGTPRLALDIGGTVRQAAYASGSSDADDLSFQYTVTASDFDGDGHQHPRGGAEAERRQHRRRERRLGGGVARHRRLRHRRRRRAYGAGHTARLLPGRQRRQPVAGQGRGDLHDAAPGHGRRHADLQHLAGAARRPDAGERTSDHHRDAHGRGRDHAHADRDRRRRRPDDARPVHRHGGGRRAGRVRRDHHLQALRQRHLRAGRGHPDPGRLRQAGKEVLAGAQAELEVDVGGTIRRFQYSGAYLGNGLLFERTVSAADRDADGISIGSDALTLGTGTLTDLETGVAAVTVIGTHAVANAAAHKVDGSVNTPLAVKSVSIVSSPASSDGYDVGESIKVEVAFSKQVSVTGAPRLALTIASNTRQAAFERSTIDYALVFAYTVTANDRDSNGIGIAAGALTLNGGSIVDAVTLSAAAALGLGTHAIADASAHKVYTPARITGASIISDPGANGTYDAGETVTVELSWSQRVIITGGTPRVALTIGSNTRQAERDAAAAARGHWYRYNYTVTAGDWDGDGISVGADALTLPADSACWATAAWTRSSRSGPTPSPTTPATRCGTRSRPWRPWRPGPTCWTWRSATRCRRRPAATRR